MQASLTYESVAPLDWFQWRALLWNSQRDVFLRQDWLAVSAAVNEACPESIPQPPEAYRDAFRNLCEYYPELASGQVREGDGMRIWTDSLYRQVPGIFGAVPPFMNLGYVNPDEPPVPLDESEEPFRFFIQLYHHALGMVEAENADILEVGCGAGGGSAYIARRYRPRSVTGIDLLPGHIDACRRYFPLPSLSFVEGDAERLPLASASYDGVVNIESSLHYPSLLNFLEEVRRVLRPGGWLMLCDLRPAGGQWGEGRSMDDLFRNFREAGLNIEHAEDISASVQRSLEVQEQARIKALASTGLGGANLKHFREILLMGGSLNRRMLDHRLLKYVCVRARKPR